MTRATLLASLATLGGLSTATLAAPTPPGPYTLTDLSTLGGQASIATGLNNNGLVIGTSSLFGDTIGNGYLFSYAGAQVSGGGGGYTLGGGGGPSSTVALTGINGLLDTAFNYTSSNSNARAIADSGDIAGYLGNHAAAFTTYIGTGAGAVMSGTEVDSVTDLGTLGGTSSAAFGIAGVPGGTDTVVGGSETGILDALGYPLSQAFVTNYSAYVGINTTPLMTASTPPTGLGVLAPFNSSAAYGIGKSNSAIVGSSYYANPFTTASAATLFTKGGAPTSLGALPGGTSSVAYDAGSSVAVGVSTNALGVFHPVTFSLSPTGTVTDLGLLPGYANGVAYGINASNQVVGNAFNLDKNGNLTTYHGFLSSGGTLYDLNSLLAPAAAGNTVQEALSINDYGQIAADGVNVNGQVHAFLLSPTPVVTGLSPSSVPSGTNVVQLTVTGTNFAPNAIVYVDGAPVPTIQYVGGSLIALLSLPPNSGGVTVDVGTPTPGGNGQVLAIGSPAITASITNISTANDQYVVTVTLNNTNGTAPAENVQFTTGTLKVTLEASVTPSKTTILSRPNAVTNYSTITPSSAVTVPAGGSQTWTLTFPKSAVPTVANANVFNGTAAVNGTFSYGTSTGTFTASQNATKFPIL